MNTRYVQNVTKWVQSKKLDFSPRSEDFVVAREEDFVVCVFEVFGETGEQTDWQTVHPRCPNVHMAQLGVLRQIFQDVARRIQTLVRP